MKTRHTAIKRTAAVAIIIGSVTFAGTGTAFAGHVHSKEVGNGNCVLLAQNGGEAEVDLPFASDAQVTVHRAHPLHLLVHLGHPGQTFDIGVAGTASDPCFSSGDYLNG